MSGIDRRTGAWVSALVFGIAAIALWAQVALSLIFGSPQVSIQALVAAGACTMTGLAAALTVGAVLGLRRVDQSGPPPDARVPEDSWWRLAAGIALTGIGADSIFSTSLGTSDWLSLSVAFFAGGYILGWASVSRIVGPFRVRKTTTAMPHLPR
jgi:hypothetical protein